MGFRFYATVIFIIALVAGVAGGVSYLSAQRREAALRERWVATLALVEEGDNEAAFKALEAFEAEAGEDADNEEVAATRLTLLRRLGDGARSARRAEEFLEKWPDSGRAAIARVTLGEAAFGEGDFQTARDHFRKARESSHVGAWRARAALGQAKIASRENDLMGARRLLDPLLDEPLPDDVRAEVEEELGDVNMEILLSRRTLERDIVYRIEPGDSLSALAVKYNVPAALLMKKNGIRDARALSVGRRVIIPVNDFRIVVDRHENTLTLYNHDRFFKRYRVRTGQDDYMTPKGDFVIQNKKIDPQWTDPRTGRVYPPGHPDNELGTRWMAFQGSMLGIHGTIHPESIGLYSSNGCVGMAREDIEELFDIVPHKTPVKIVGEQNPEIRKRSAEYSNERAARDGDEDRRG